MNTEASNFQADKVLTGSQLRPGLRAPDFTISDVMGNPVSLRKYSNKKLALLFYRYAGCPFCQLHFHNFLREYPRYAEHGLEVVVFFQSPPESIKKYLSQENVSFPIVGDPGKSVYREYGVESSLAGALRSMKDLPLYINTLLPSQGKIDGNFTLMPAGFLIDGDQTIKVAHYGTSFGDQISPKDIHEFLYADDIRQSTI